MVLVGLGSGMFPLALTMIGLRARTAETTAALSAFVQAIGYIVAGAGPLLFGVLYGATEPLGAAARRCCSSRSRSRCRRLGGRPPRFVDDELAASSAMTASRTPRQLRRSDFAVLRALPTRWSDDDTYGHVNNVVHYSMFDTAVNGWLIEASGVDIRAAARDRARRRDVVPVLQPSCASRRR